MTKQNTAVVFDWNGTVVDDAAAAVSGTNDVLAHYGLAPVDVNRVRAEYTMPFFKTYIALGLDPVTVDRDVQKIVDLWQDGYTKANTCLNLRKGAEKAFSSLRNNGHKLAVLSNYAVDKIQVQASLLNLHSMFDAILANEALVECMKGRSKGDRLKDFLEEHTVHKAIVIGDTAEEIEIAHRYGQVGVAITGGMSSEEKLHAANPDYLIHTLEDLPAIASEVFAA